MTKRNDDFLSTSYKDLLDILVKNTLKKHGVKPKKNIPTKEKQALRSQFKALEEQVQKFIQKGMNKNESENESLNESVDEVMNEMETIIEEKPMTKKRVKRIRVRKL
jgi:hypothetical protein